MKSIRTRLFAILIVTTGAMWISAIAWIYFSTQMEVEKVLDARLAEAARMVSSLVASQSPEPAIDTTLQADLAVKAAYDRQLSCQIWSFDGKLLGRTDAAPMDPLTPIASGFSNVVVKGEQWRVFALENAPATIRIMVGDNVRVRDGLVNGVIKGLLLPAIFILPLVAVSLWISLTRGLAPLRRMAWALADRDASDLQPVPHEDAADEIRPVIRSLNGLLARLTAAREHERNFTAFAAHELRTPIAGLKTHAQIALLSGNSEMHRRALKQIAASVDRTSRLIRQITDLTAAESKPRDAPARPFNAGSSLKMLRDEFQFSGANWTSRIEISPALFEISLYLDQDLFLLAARNLIENALHHTPPDRVIACSAENMQNGIAIYVDDEGPGIPQEEVSRVRERFFRGRRKSEVGSGLGLSIVDMALSRVEGRLELINRSEGGLRAAIYLPRVRSANYNSAPALLD